jgi:hypothetical protein
MKKYFPLVAIAILCLVGFGYFSYQRMVSPKTLSVRAQEYIKDRAGEGDVFWKNINLTGTAKSESVAPEENSPQSLQQKNACFSLSIPFKIRVNKINDRCSDYFSLEDPLGEVVVYLRPIEQDSLDQVADVMMRRANPDLYEEDHTTVNGKTYLVFQRRDNTYEQTAFYLKEKELFVINLTIYSGQAENEKFMEMLSSVKMYNE